MGKPQLIICGSIAIDRIMNFSGRYRDLIKPDKLHVLSISPLLDKLENSRGGIGANIASNIAQLGEKPVLLGSVGSDAQKYIEDLHDLGIDTSSIHYSQLPTASFNVITDSEGSQVGGFYPGAMADSSSLTLKQWKGQDVIACISANDPAAMRRLCQEAASYNMRLLYDPGQQVSNVSGEDLRIGIDAAEVVIVNDYELDVLLKKTGLSADELAANVKVVIGTYGKEGSVINGQDLEECIKIPAAKPAKVVDPTGAGDAYRAGFLYGYLRQWDLAVCGQLGATLASFIVERHGTQHQFSKQAIVKRYRDNFKQEIEL